MNIERETQEFIENIVPFGYLDIKRAIEVYSEVDKSGDDLAEDVRGFSDDTGTKFEDIDVVCIAYETILQESRNKLSDLLNQWDFLNDGEGDIYTAGNYLATSYDQTENLINEINEKLSELNKQELEDTLKEFKEDKVLKWFLNEVGFELNLEGKNDN